MKRFARQNIILITALLLIWVIGRIVVGNTFTAYVPIGYQERESEQFSLKVTGENGGAAAVGEPVLTDERVRLDIKPENPGMIEVEILNGAGEPTALGIFRIGRFGTVYDYSSGNFTGDKITMAVITIFVFMESLLLYLSYRRAKGAAFYSYSTIYSVGFSIFLLLTGIVLLISTIRRIVTPATYLMLNFYSQLSAAGYNFMIYTFPFILAFAVAMTISNIALLRHERPRLQNAMGILVSVLMVAGVVAVFLFAGRNFMGSEFVGRIYSTITNTVSTAYAYFECMLIGAIICGLKAAKHVPKGAVDYILILGCGFRKDGTLPPLLKGRVDRAISFWKEQKEHRNTAILVPSGGQGPNEVMPEAEAMKRYLLSQGIPEEYIHPEDKSRNTYQNMLFSKQLIEKEKKDARVVFSTTNYHVFRSGLWASLAGLKTEGIGSETKWWFWPNAFMRECVGLMVNRWKQEALLLLLLIFVFGTMSMVL